MKRILGFAIMLFAMAFSHVALAQNAVSILDKAASVYRNAGGVKAQFMVSSEGNSSTGLIMLSGQKFFCNMGGGLMTWFDGKTMWSYVVSNEEVNVTTPTGAELSRINPYAFLSMYKKNYKASMGKSTGLYYEVVLNATDSGSSLRKVVIRISKSSYHPLYIKLVSRKVVNEITVTGYTDKQKYADSTFRFDSKKYPKAEVIDLR